MCIRDSSLSLSPSLLSGFISVSLIFRPNDTRIEFKVGFKDDPWSGLEGSVVVVIRAYAPDRFYATLHLYTVGRLDVILDQIAGTSSVPLTSDLSRSQQFASI